jgi:hypothetical protein
MPIRHDDDSLFNGDIYELHVRLAVFFSCLTSG